MSIQCTHCDDTGSLSKDIEGQMDCVYCDVAGERAGLEIWALRNGIRGGIADLWLIYQHGKGTAPAKIDSHNNATARDVQRGSSLYTSGDEILAEDVGYVLGWNACVDAIHKS